MSEEYKFIETVKHSFVTRDDDEAEFTAIRIDEGKFKNMIYAYNEIQVPEEEREDGGLDLNFSILEIKSDNDNHKIHEEEFHKVVGDILVSCLEKSLAKEDNFDIIYRENNSKSLAEQRKLQSEGITISEE
tara:strand:+ start:101 stop:493 length:393 start_codon:yes stop_codon:yes gene_type:complete